MYREVSYEILVSFLVRGWWVFPRLGGFLLAVGLGEQPPDQVIGRHLWGEGGIRGTVLGVGSRWYFSCGVRGVKILRVR